MKTFSNLKELVQFFSDEDTCRAYLEEHIWGDTPTCPHCSSKKSYTLRGTKTYRCANRYCKKTYSVTVGTIFENSNIPLSSWYIAIYLLISHKKGISSYQLSRDIGVTQATAWHMLHRIRKAMSNNELQFKFMDGVVEADETFVGGKNKNRHWDKKVKYSQGRSFKDKTPVLGLLLRKGFIKCFVIPDTKAITIQPIVAENVVINSTLMTDEWKAYRGLDVIYNHQYVDHGRKQYVDGDCYTNGVENFWSILKRTIIGIYHNVGRKHLQKYCDECAYRFNTRKLTDKERFTALFSQIMCKLTYKELVGA